MEGHSLQAMKIVSHHANGHFDWLISGYQSINHSREAISILSGKYKDLRLSILWLTDSLRQLSLKRCHSISENIPRSLTWTTSHVLHKLCLFVQKQ